MSEPEEWRTIARWPAYEVSSLGRVRRAQGGMGARAGRARRIAPNTHGYPSLPLRRDGKQTTVEVHVLVAEAFHGPRPAGLEVCHGDGNPLNNRAENLRWDTRSANALDAVQHGANRNANRTHCRRGHEFTPENTVPANHGRGRRCLTCRRERQRVADADRIVKTHCPQGHPYDEVNTYITPKGWRDCRTCRKAASARAAQRRAAA